MVNKFRLVQRECEKKNLLENPPEIQLDLFQDNLTAAYNQGVADGKVLGQKEFAAKLLEYLNV